MTFDSPGGIHVFTDQERDRDRRPLTEKADPLALSWASFGLWVRGGHRWASWLDIEAAPHDHDMAANTRRYYRNKLAMIVLKSGEELTDFQKELYQICNGGIMRECHRGLLYRLPYFYVEDTERETLRQVTLAHPEFEVPTPLKQRQTRTLVPYKRIFSSHRRSEIMEYWWHDQEEGYAVKWPVVYDNPLRGVVDHLHRQEQPLDVDAHWNIAVDRRTGFKFWYVVAPELRFG